MRPYLPRTMAVSETDFFARAGRTRLMFNLGGWSGGIPLANRSKVSYRAVAFAVLLLATA